MTNILNKSGSNNLPAFQKFGKLMEKADSYDCLAIDDGVVEFQPGIYQAIWIEADKLRKDGELLKSGINIKCPVVAIHGDYDAHPANGVKEPLTKILADFKFVYLHNCGHYPWKEKQARDTFFEIIENEFS
jgi:pimeloyl-ACP methyl ester carboxylesterase